MKKLLLLHIIFFIGCNSNTKDPIIEYQQSLINDGKQVPMCLKSIKMVKLYTIRF